MVRSVSIILGIGLAILWIAGLSSPNAAPWLTWLDGAAALCSFIIAGAINPRVSMRSSRAGAPIALSIGLFALWIIGLATNVVGWLAWWTFAFACAYLLLGIAAGSSRLPVSVTGPTEKTDMERERERFRRSA